jgi:hypothetical protein
MSPKFVRAPNSPVLIGAAIALFWVATVGIDKAVLNANHYRVPVMVLAGSAVKDAVFGVALLYVALRKSQFAGATAVIIATFLTFGVAIHALAAVAFEPVHIGWGVAIDLAIAAAILWPSVFPWSRSANKPVLFWMGLTFGTLTLLVGTVTVLARL